jgi:hypothetical protein
VGEGQQLRWPGPARSRRRSATGAQRERQTARDVRVRRTGGTTRRCASEPWLRSLGVPQTPRLSVSAVRRVGHAATGKRQRAASFRGADPWSEPTTRGRVGGPPSPTERARAGDDVDRPGARAVAGRLARASPSRGGHRRRRPGDAVLLDGHGHVRWPRTGSAGRCARRSRGTRWHRGDGAATQVERRARPGHDFADAHVESETARAIVDACFTSTPDPTSREHRAARELDRSGDSPLSVVFVSRSDRRRPRRVRSTSPASCRAAWLCTTFRRCRARPFPPDGESLVAAVPVRRREDRLDSFAFVHLEMSVIEGAVPKALRPESRQRAR